MNKFTTTSQIKINPSNNQNIQRGTSKCPLGNCVREDDDKQGEEISNLFRLARAEKISQKVNAMKNAIKLTFSNMTI